jgi:hypothetical protein
MKCKFCFVLFLEVSIYFCGGVSEDAENKLLTRKRRYLTFPAGSTFVVSRTVIIRHELVHRVYNYLNIEFHVHPVLKDGKILLLLPFSRWGRDSAVGIATRYGLDDPGIESRWGRDFSQPSRPVLGPTQPPIKWVPGLFPGSKATGAWSWPPTLI